MNDAQAKEMGEKIIEILDLKTHDGKINTTYGKKTAIGFGRLVTEIISDYISNDDEL